MAKMKITPRIKESNSHAPNKENIHKVRRSSSLSDQAVTLMLYRTLTVVRRY